MKVRFHLRSRLRKLRKPHRLPKQRGGVSEVAQVAQEPKDTPKDEGNQGKMDAKGNENLEDVQLRIQKLKCLAFALSSCSLQFFCAFHAVLIANKYEWVQSTYIMYFKSQRFPKLKHTLCFCLIGREKLNLRQCARPLQVQKPLPQKPAVDATSLDALPFDMSPAVKQYQQLHPSEPGETIVVGDSQPVDVKDSVIPNSSTEPLKDEGEMDTEHKDSTDGSKDPEPEDLFHSTEGVKRLDQMHERKTVAQNNENVDVEEGGQEEEEPLTKKEKEQNKKQKKKLTAQAKRAAKKATAKAKAALKKAQKKEKGQAKKAEKAEKAKAKKEAKAKAKLEKSKGSKQDKEVAKSGKKKKDEKDTAGHEDKVEEAQDEVAKAGKETKKRGRKSKVETANSKPADGDAMEVDSASTSKVPTPSKRRLTSDEVVVGGKEKPMEKETDKKSFARRFRPQGSVAGQRWDGVKFAFNKHLRHKISSVSAMEACKTKDMQKLHTKVGCTRISMFNQQLKCPPKIKPQILKVEFWNHCATKIKDASCEITNCAFFCEGCVLSFLGLDKVKGNLSKFNDAFIVVFSLVCLPLVWGRLRWLVVPSKHCPQLRQGVGWEVSSDEITRFLFWWGFACSQHVGRGAKQVTL